MKLRMSSDDDQREPVLRFEKQWENVPATFTVMHVIGSYFSLLSHIHGRLFRFFF